MKPAFYESLDKIPEADRNDYKIVTESGSPNFNKYVLDLDPQHPVALKNVELLGEKTTRDTAQAAAVQAAVAPLQTQVQTLTTQLRTAQSQNGLPAGQVAVAADVLTTYNNFKTLGEFDQVKAKVEEHGTLKEQTEAQNRKTLFNEIANAKGLDPEVFADLAEETKLHDRIEIRKTTDDKGATTTEWFVKGKDDKGADSETAIGSFVGTDPKFKKFERSLVLSEEARKKLPIPAQKHGDSPSEKSAADSYINSTYQRPDFDGKDKS